MITTQIEIARSPEEVRKTLLDFASYPEWHSGLIKSITPLSASENPLAKDSKLHCVMEGFTFDSVITENTPSSFQWQGPPVKTVAGLHTFTFKPSATTEGGTTFSQIEQYSGGVSFLMQPWLLARPIKGQFEKFNRDLKARVESLGGL